MKLEKLNPFCKALTILLVGVILSFSYSPRLNFIVFGASAAGILLFTDARKDLLLKLLLPAALAAAALFMTGLLFSSGGSGEAALSAREGYNFSAAINSSRPLYNAVQLSGRVLAFAGIGLLFALSTDGEEFISSLMHQCHLSPKFAYGILAAFHLMPTMARELEEARLAFQVRGVRLPRWSLKPVFAMMVNSVRWSESVAMAMESKGFSGSGTRTYYHVTHVRWYDMVFLAAAVGMTLLGMLL